jgi:putative ABC transport system substrate-binding protein
MLSIGRREFVSLLGGAAVTWPRAAWAQQSAVPVIGFLNSASPEAFAPFVAAFQSGLNELGYIEGRNVMIEYRSAEGHPDRLPPLVDDLVRRQVAVLVVRRQQHGSEEQMFGAKQQVLRRGQGD